MTAEPLANGTATGSVQAISHLQLWAGRILSGFAALFCLMDGAMKLVKPDVVVKATQELGFPESDLVGIGLALLACTFLYVFPRTSILGAILLTGYLGGAVASQVRIGAKWSSLIFPIVFAILIWAGLWLRDVRVRSFLP